MTYAILMGLTHIISTAMLRITLLPPYADEREGDIGMEVHSDDALLSPPVDEVISSGPSLGVSSAESG